MRAALRAAMRVTAGAALALGLLGCTSDQEPLDLYAVSGDLGAAPTVVFTPPLQLTDPVIETEFVGDGRVVGDGPVLVAISTFSGQDGAPVGELAAPNIVDLAQLPDDSELQDALREATEGSRLVALQAVEDDVGERMELVVIDVLPTRYTGTPQTVDFAAESLPEIGESEEGDPTAVVAEGVVEPDALRVFPLAKGEGAQVRPGDTVFAQYTVWTWDEGEVLESTWDDNAGPSAIAIDTTFPGLRDGVMDQQVGSRVLILVPADLGIGTDSLVAVVDILAIGRTE